MKKIEAIQALRNFDEKGKFIFTRDNFNKLFPYDNLKTLDEALHCLVKDGLLLRACRGIYVNKHAQSKDSYVIEHIAKTLRRGEYAHYTSRCEIDFKNKR